MAVPLVDIRAQLREQEATFITDLATACLEHSRRLRAAGLTVSANEQVRLAALLDILADEALEASPQTHPAAPAL